MKRVVVYCRVSTDHEDQKNSLENQRLYFEEYVKQHKDWKLVEIYADEGISGTSLKKRADFNRMYRDRLKNKYDIVLTKEVCRFARNTVDTLEKTRELKKLGIEVRFIIDNISTFDTDGELRLTIMAGLAQDESRRISERVQFGVIQSMKKGVAFGNIVYGYDFVRDPITGKKTKLVINEKEAKIIKEIFNMYLYEGKGAYTIAKELKERGIEIKRTRSGKKSTDWREGTILDILQNVKYIGDLKQRKTYTVDFLEHSKKENKGEVEFIYTSNHHEPIIDRDLFEATQRELKRRSEIYKHEKSKYTNKHTFSGKLVCACCGSSYVGGENRKRKDGTIRKTWRCYTATKYGKKHEENGQDIGCNNDRVNNETLKICFMKALKEVLINKKEIKKETEQYIKLVLNKCGQETQLNDILVKDKEQLMKERSRLLDLCIKGIVDEETFSLKNNEIIEKINKIEIELDSQKQKVRMKENAEETLEKIQKTIDNILNIKKFSKNVCKEFVDKIVIYNDKKFDFYLKGYDTSFNFNEESNISYLPH